jgi:cyanate lyase
MLGHDELLDWLKDARDDGRVSNADIMRLLKLPSSRVAEIFEGRRRIKLDEAKALVEHYGIEESAGVNEATLAPILSAVLPLAPHGEDAEKFAPVLAQAVAYGFQLLADSHARKPSEDAIGVAARGAALRFRDLLLQ